MCKLSKQLVEYANAGFSGVYIKSYEHTDALEIIRTCANNNDWDVLTWDADRGLNGLNVDNFPNMEDCSPLVAIHMMGQKETMDLLHKDKKFLVMKNMHKFIDTPEMIQALDYAIMEGKRDGRYVVILSSVLKLPCEIEKHFVILEHHLPDEKEMEKILDDIATEATDIEPDQRMKVVKSSAGLTRFEAEGAFALSLVRKGKIEPSTVWDIKEATIKKSGLMTLYKGKESFDELGGLASLKSYCKDVLTNNKPNKSKVKVYPKGVMLVGVSGTGKSAFAKALGNEVGRPTITLDIGALMGSLVGQTEENTRKALAVIDEMQPCVLFIDEIEKALAGTSGNGSNDSGVSKRMLGAFLTWLNDHITQVYVICTSNDITVLPTEFTRAGRFDRIFFLDIPTREQKDMIWPIYEDMFGIDNQERPDDSNWTGSEIKSCCSESVLMGCSLIKASKGVIPVAVTSAEKIAHLRTQATNRYNSSEFEGVYTANEQAINKNEQPLMHDTKGRKITRAAK